MRMVLEITEVRKGESSFFIRYDKPIRIDGVAAQLASDYKEFFNEDASPGPSVFDDDFDKGLTLKIKDNELGDGWFNFADVSNPVQTGSVHQVKVRQNQDWSDDYHFLEFHAELLGKYRS